MSPVESLNTENIYMTLQEDMLSSSSDEEEEEEEGQADIKSSQGGGAGDLPQEYWQVIF